MTKPVSKKRLYNRIILRKNMFWVDTLFHPVSTGVTNAMTPVIGYKETGKILWKRLCNHVIDTWTHSTYYIAYRQGRYGEKVHCQASESKIVLNLRLHQWLLGRRRSGVILVAKVALNPYTLLVHFFPSMCGLWWFFYRASQGISIVLFHSYQLYEQWKRLHNWRTTDEPS